MAAGADNEQVVGGAGGDERGRHWAVPDAVFGGDTAGELVDGRLDRLRHLGGVGRGAGRECGVAVEDRPHYQGGVAQARFHNGPGQCGAGRG